MKYKIQAYSIWEQGHYRGNQEDSIFPKLGEIQSSDRLFILCDGMGGHDHGEVASAAVCEAMSEYVLSQCEPEGDFSDDILRNAVESAFDALDEKDTGAAKKMGTTMTFLKLHAGGATIGHIGDSRVYHIRPGKTADDTQILFQTRDHSLVNDLIKIGELTEEEAKHSKQKNVITRAMQPNMERRPSADIHHVTDIQPGDYFFMCSDGMLDQMDNDNFKFIFSKAGITDEEKVKMLIGASDDSHDNHTAHIVHIMDVTGASAPIVLPAAEERKPTFVVEAEDSEEHKEPEIDESTPRSSRKKMIFIPIILLVVALLGVGAYYFVNKGDAEVKADTIANDAVPETPNKKGKTGKPKDASTQKTDAKVAPSTEAEPKEEKLDTPRISTLPSKKITPEEITPSENASDQGGSIKDKVLNMGVQKKKV